VTHELMLRLELGAFMDAYASILDNDRIEEWPAMFTEACLYEIIPQENEAQGLPAPVMYCDNGGMLRDRVVALRNANIYEKPQYRHFMSGLTFQVRPDGALDVQSSYLVVNTSQAGVTTVYQAGCYMDIIVRVDGHLKFQARRCIYDTSRIQTLLAYPV